MGTFCVCVWACVRVNFLRVRVCAGAFVRASARADACLCAFARARRSAWRDDRPGGAAGGGLRRSATTRHTTTCLPLILVLEAGITRHGVAILHRRAGEGTHRSPCDQHPGARGGARSARCQSATGCRALALPRDKHGWVMGAAAAAGSRIPGARDCPTMQSHIASQLRHSTASGGVSRFERDIFFFLKIQLLLRGKGEVRHETARRQSRRPVGSVQLAVQA